ncbi:preprotein translocase subunit SecG [uncultured Porphyromonas sp.]|uniref:preprotein translocase subunit SecG n=1 Tax=uncultured Porphyromonas sp. TaxID=159274 RepID=UPI0005E24AB4|nr:preprotein translocase subunit SecG [uncultured Porphyromonas sp.]CQB87219.1 preprotein translocase subunit SecG [Chlamydia trachomatis]
MYVFLSILIVLASIAIVFVITIQNSKGGGLASGFAASNNVMGVRRTTDLIEKITWGLAIAIALLAIISVKWAPRSTSTQSESVVLDQVDQATLPEVPEAAKPFGDTPATTEAPAEQTPAEPATSK